MVKNPPVKAGDMGLIPGLGRSPGKGNGNPLQYSCLENPMDFVASYRVVLQLLGSVVVAQKQSQTILKQMSVAVLQ